MTQGSEERLYILCSSMSARMVLGPMQANGTVRCYHPDKFGESVMLMPTPREDRTFVGFHCSDYELVPRPFGTVWTLVTASELVRLRLTGTAYRIEEPPP